MRLCGELCRRNKSNLGVIGRWVAGRVEWSLGRRKWRQTRGGGGYISDRQKVLDFVECEVRFTKEGL